MQQAINRAFDIMEYVALDPENASSFNSIAENTGLNTGTCANIIKAMVKRGYLEKLDDKKGYLIGKKVYQLTSYDGYRKDFIKIAKPILEALTEKVNENALFGILKESSRIVLFQTKSKQEIQATSAIDKHAYDSSTGRFLVAMLSDNELENFVSKYGLPTPTQWKEASTSKSFKKVISQIRNDGYVFQESERHITGIAVGVSVNEKIIAAICIFLPSFRLTPTNKNLLINELKKAAKKISAEIA